MALVFFDGLDLYANDAQFTRRWVTSYALYDRVGRYGIGKCVRMPGNNSAAVSFSSPAINVNFSFYNPTSSIGYMPWLVRLYDDSAGADTVQAHLGWNTLGQLVVFRQSQVEVGRATKSFRPSTWNHVEWYLAMSNSTGQNHCVVRLNGEEVINLVGVDVQNTANSLITRASISAGNYLEAWMDDVSIWTEEVTNTPVFRGDLRVQTLYPNGNGNYSQFVGSDGNSVNNFELVDEATISDTDYVGSSTVGNKDSYVIGDLLANTANIHAVQVVAQLTKSDAGARTGKTFIRLDGADYEGPEAYPPGTPNAFVQLMHTNPATGAAWNVSEINDLEIGIKVES